MTYPPHIQALTRPAAYPPELGVTAVKTLETHISHLFLTGKRVYKVKKPVDFGFLNFTTLARRRHFCREEVRLNRRLSPDAYLGVSDIRRQDGAYRVDGPGRVVDYAVVMRQLPAERSVRRLLERGELTASHVRLLAERILEFHRRADATPAIARGGGPRAVRRSINENFVQTANVVGVTVTQPVYDLLRAYSQAFLETEAPLFRRRAAEGRIRDCHGDLHTAQIYLEQDPAAPLGVHALFLDCIEFNKRFRYTDVASDLAFLAMDLEHLSRPDLSEALVERYVELSGDTELPHLLPFYKAYRAYVRGKVEGFRLGDTSLTDVQRSAIRKSAARYFTLAASYARPAGPLLIVVCGLMGTGKTSLAKAFGERLEAEVISSDVVRKTSRGLSATERVLEPWGQGLYAESAVEQTYQDLLNVARPRLAAGGSVILDASYRKDAWRAAARTLAHETGASFVLVECRAPDAVVRRRIQARLAEAKDASDARWELYQQQKASFEPVRGISRAEHLVVDTSAPLPEVTLASLRKLFHALLLQRGPALQPAALGAAERDTAAHRLSA
jgi:hypothetical protein